MAVPVSVWQGGTGVWSDPTMWTAPGPGAGYQAYIPNNSPASQVTVDVVTATLDSLGLGAGASLFLKSTMTAGSVQSFGAFTASPGGVLKIGAGGFVQDGAAATIFGTGSQALDTGHWSQGNGSLVVNGSLSTDLVHVTGGSVTAGNGGLISIGAGGYTQDLAVTTSVAQGGQLVTTGAYSQGNGSTVVNGALSADVLSVTGGTVAVNNGGKLTVNTGGYAQGKSGTSTTIAAGGQLTVSKGDFSQEIGTSTVVDGTLTATAIHNSGTMSGTGTVNGSVDNRGTLAPGDGGIGTFTIQGDYSQTGFLDVEIGGHGLADLLSVSGTASLGGTLDVALLNGFLPKFGERFLVMTYSSRTGSYYNVLGSGLPGGALWTAIYDPTALYVTLLQPVSTPEPASFFAAANGLAALVLAMARKRRAV